MKLNKMHLFIILASAIIFSVIIGPNLIEGLTTSAPVDTTTSALVDTTTSAPVTMAPVTMGPVTMGPVKMAPVPTLGPLSNTNLLASSTNLTNLGDGNKTISAVNNSRNNTFNIDSSRVNEQENLLNSNNTSDNNRMNSNNNRMNRNNNNDNVMDDSSVMNETDTTNVSSNNNDDMFSNQRVLPQSDMMGFNNEIDPARREQILAGEVIEDTITQEEFTKELLEEEANRIDALSDGVTRDQIPAGQEGRYILKSEIVPPVCPACPPINSCPMREPPPPCPPCARCPKPEFECKKIPIYSSSNKSLPTRMPDPMPVLNDFSKF